MTDKVSKTNRSINERDVGSRYIHLLEASRVSLITDDVPLEPRKIHFSNFFYCFVIISNIQPLKYLNILISYLLWLLSRVTERSFEMFTIFEPSIAPPKDTLFSLLPDSGDALPVTALLSFGSVWLPRQFSLPLVLRR